MKSWDIITSGSGKDEEQGETLCPLKQCQCLRIRNYNFGQRGDTNVQWDHAPCTTKKMDWRNTHKHWKHDKILYQIVRKGQQGGR